MIAIEGQTNKTVTGPAGYHMSPPSMLRVIDVPFYSV